MSSATPASAARRGRSGKADILHIVALVAGLAILIFAGDVLVRGAVNMSLRLGVPTLVVSLTVVAFGTSAPELLIAVQSALAGVPGIAFGNVVGSNTANVLLVLGVPAMIATMHTSQIRARRSFYYMMGASVAFALILFLGPIDWRHGTVLLVLLAAMLVQTYRLAQAHRAAGVAHPPRLEAEELPVADPHMPWWRIGFYLALGLVGLPLGADLLVDGATGIARAYGVSETVIGLTLVAVGTSLPELATTVSAALRREADVAIGNVIGSNMFNILGIMGVTALFGPLAVPPGILSLDLWVMLGTSLLLIPFVIFRLNVTRLWGVVFTGLYAAYVYVLLGVGA